MVWTALLSDTYTTSECMRISPMSATSSEHVCDTTEIPESTTGMCMQATLVNESDVNEHHKQHVC